MSQVETIIRYDGPALATHEMDVQALAPALLALANLIQSANHKFNGDKSAVRVVVNADIEQKCFQIKIKLIQDILEKAKSFLDGDMATLKDICEWVGIIGGGSLSLFKLLIALGKKNEDSTVFNATSEGDGTIMQIQNLHLHLPEGTPPQVQQLLSDPNIFQKAQEVLKPAALPGYDHIGFYRPKDGIADFAANKAEVRAALALPVPANENGEEEVPDGEPTSATGPAWVDTSHFRGAAKWVLLWNGVKIDAKMPDDFLTKFQSNEIIVVPNSKLMVRMTITPKVDANGTPLGPTSFVVDEVLSIELPPKAAIQTGMFDDEP